jgi:hypothetical protein
VTLGAAARAAALRIAVGLAGVAATALGGCGGAAPCRSLGPGVCVGAPVAPRAGTAAVLVRPVRAPSAGPLPGVYDLAFLADDQTLVPRHGPLVGGEGLQAALSRCAAGGAVTAPDPSASANDGGAMSR